MMLHKGTVGRFRGRHNVQVGLERCSRWPWDEISIGHLTCLVMAAKSAESAPDEMTTSLPLAR